jgi:hypothetical protein
MNSILAVETGHDISKPLHWKWRLLLTTVAAFMLAALQYLPVRADGSIGGVGDICPFRHLTGLPCPLCGMTRSVLCFFQGNLHASLLWYPLGPLVGIGVVMCFLTMVIPGIGIEHLAAKLPQRFCGIALLILVAGCWALRLAGVFPLPLSP